MVLSPFATANIISKLPKNFYSLTPPDLCESNAIAQFIKQRFPGKNILILTQADCKSCVGVTNDFIIIQKKINLNSKITKHIILMDNIKTLPLKNILKNTNNNTIVFLPDMAYQTAILMPRITNYLKRSVIFIGGDNWGDWKDGMVGKIKASHSYAGFRIVPWSGEDFARKLFDDGYKNIVLETGYPKECFQHAVWLRDVVGKNPPWG